MMYVSYRIGDRVYWTRRKLLISADETLITDGENFVRARCGNRISPIAMEPTAIADPPWEKLNAPKFVPPLLSRVDPPEDPGSFAAATPLLAHLPRPLSPGDPNISDPGGSLGPIFLPGFLPPAGSGTHQGGSSSTPPIAQLDPPSPVVTSEPGSLLMVTSGALFCVMWRRKRNQPHT